MFSRAGFVFLLVLSAAAQEVKLPELAQPATAHIDSYGAPHVYAASWPDAAMVLGYLHARDRLFQMDFYRRMASGTLAEVAGRDHLDSDILMRRLRIRKTCEQFLASADYPQAMRADLEAYSKGVNARIHELGAEGLPDLFKALGYAPAPWEPVDCLVFIRYMGWDQGGTDDDLWLGALVEKMGPAAVDELWPLDRPYEVPAVKSHVDRAPYLTAKLEALPGAAEIHAAMSTWLERTRPYGRGGAFGSNNWAIAGSRTVSGKPILCSDPHLGFSLPMLWYTAHVTVGDESVAGAFFPVAPFVIIGHNDRLGWGITNMQSDAVDYFIETIDPREPSRYLHKNEWKTVERAVETITIKGEPPHEEVIEYTVHGLLITREPKAIAMQWTGFGQTRDGLALWMLNRARNLSDALKALDEIHIPALNMAYADADGNILIHPCGDLPIRTPGQGRIPMDGASGQYDWKGLIPRKDLPLNLNPPEGYIASANGRPAGTGFPFYLGWMWDPSYRTRRAHDLLSGLEGMTVDKMKAIQNDAYDKAAERFLPVLLDAVANWEPQDAFEEAILDALRGWDYRAVPESKAPLPWLTWFTAYRDLVWNDEWEVRGIEKKGGSWGFTGDNRREPMLEVLEFITREFPTSPWFDRQNTAEEETRDDIIRLAFRQGLDILKQETAADINKLTWSERNIVRVRHMLGAPELAREGGPIPGDTFTLNPGGEGGGVGGGASYRLIVDFGDIENSIGIYPGGQSEDPASPNYSDQLSLWAKGEYIPLHMKKDPAQLPPQAKSITFTFTP